MTTLEVVVEVSETAPGKPFALTEAQAAALAGSRLVNVDPIGAGRWLVTGSGKVGVARVGDVVLRVQPKVTIGKLFWLLGFARRFDWRDDLVDYDTESDLVHVLAEAFARQADRTLGRGVLHGYVPVDDELAVVRGRLRATEQVTRRFGQIAPLLVTYDEFTPDIAENRLVRAAARTLRGVPRLYPPVARHLRGIVDRLDGVADLRPGAPLPPWRPNRRNAHYETTLWLAEVVLRHQSLDLSAGVIDVNGFMIDMAAVFEDFVTVALTGALEGIDGHVRPQDRHSLDAAGQVELKPDLVWHRAGRPAGVIDVKYKAEKPAGYPNADVYQMLAYCTALGLGVGHLIYAKGNEPQLTHLIRNSPVRIEAHALDLEQTPVAILDQVDQLASVVANRTCVARAACAGLSLRPTDR